MRLRFELLRVASGRLVGQRSRLFLLKLDVPDIQRKLHN